MTSLVCSRSQFDCMSCTTLPPTVRMASLSVPPERFFTFLGLCGSIFGVKLVLVVLCFGVHDCLPSLYCVVISLSFSPSLFTDDRPLLSLSRLLCFPTSRSPSATSSLYLQRTPASVPTLASRTASMARRLAVGLKRWTSTGKCCTSANILTRRYRPHGGLLPLLHWGDSWMFYGGFCTCMTQMFPVESLDVRHISASRLLLTMEIMKVPLPLLKYLSK